MTTTQGNLFTFRSGGWVLLLALAVSIGLTLWAMLPVLTRERPPGDGSTIDSYGFDLSPLLVDDQYIATPLLHRDMLPRLDHPDTITAAQAKWLNEQERGKFLVSTDRVAGVVIEGEARAYPLSLLTVHEVINDTLGGQPIAVTYSWPGDAVRVFDRNVAGETLTFGVSGLLYNGNLLLYDRREDDASVPYEQRGESLWSQLLSRAVAGPAAAAERKLQTHVAQVVSWSQWQAMYPDTTVIERDPQLIKRYRRATPTQYFISEEPPSFPVKHQPEHGPELKEPVLVVSAGGEQRVYPRTLIARRSGATEHATTDATIHTWTDELGGVDVTFSYDAAARTAAVTADAEIDIIHCFWFAWHAMHPDAELAGE